MKRSYAALEPLYTAAISYLHYKGNDRDFKLIFRQIDKESRYQLSYGQNMKRNKLSTEDNEATKAGVSIPAIDSTSEAEVESEAEIEDVETKAMVAEIEKNLDKAAIKYHSLKKKLNCIDMTKLLIQRGFDNEHIKRVVYFKDEEIDSMRTVLQSKKEKKKMKKIKICEKIASNQATREKKLTKKNSENEKKIKTVELLRRKRRHKTPLADIENQQKESPLIQKNSRRTLKKYFRTY